MPYVGQTPLGNLATTDLNIEYQNYVISQAEMGLPAIGYDQWFQMRNQQPPMQSGLNPLQGDSSMVQQ